MSEIDSVGRKIEAAPIQPEKKETAGEKIPAPEVIIEKKPEMTEKPVVTPAVRPTPMAVPVKDPELVKIEKVLEEDLEDFYYSLPPNRQAAFKKRGEETALKIRILIHKTKVNIKKIIHLIRQWLKMLPGVNRFFLEQESKIKADKIVQEK